MNDSWLKRSVMLRMTIIGCLTLAMLIPSVLVMGLISEREQTRNSAIAEVSEKWGARQTIAGPVLTLPFKRMIRTEKGDARTVIEHAQLLPATLAISANVSPEVRYRGIYQVTLYNTVADIRGTFTLEGLAALNIKAEDVVWEEASLTFGVSDLKGVKEAINVRWGNKEFPAEPGVGADNSLRSGINIKPVLSPGQQHDEFAVKVNLNGSDQLQFVPVGKETNVTVSSSWKSPSFVGRFLPDQRTVGEAGFDAKWSVLHLNRNFPQQWISERLSGENEKIQFDQFAFGVKLISPLDQYQQTLRSAKYAIMFVALTFLAFFLTEVLTNKVGHPVHYALIGFALVLFYCLLLSLSEHMSFLLAYVTSSTAIVLLIGGYSRSVLGTNRFAATISSLLALLYTFLFVILQEKDYALLFGSTGLFAVLALVMYLTRKIDWFTVGKSEGTA
ncbi:MAG: cell envelope integrity protein CreD [Bacteroidetes bacterium]|nr:cell envelope integrity protein CreD [Bacteroidota bacterium]MCW5894136.1 cell envelope integrity protein CreD [Bacteroidota bacterium]